VHFPVSCTQPAQREFDRAVALLHHMTYPAAQAAFRRVAAADSGCAMAYWGIAMTLFQPLWPTRPGPAELREGWEAAQRARSLEPPTERERLFVAAAEAFFSEPAGSDYWLRIRRWEGAMAAVHAAFPDDDEATAFYALARLATSPADTVSRAHADEAAALLVGIYRRNPDHPGAMHYLIHANDVPGRQREQLDVTRKYESIAPHNPHALHMPTHIYTRLGDWNGVIRGNQRAAEAALAAPAGDQGQFVWDEFPHALEYLIYAYLQQGADDRALAELDRLLDTPHLQPSFKTAFHLSSTRARYALERRAWAEAADLPPRDPPTLDWDRFAWPEAITQFARGLGAVHLNRPDEAHAAAARLDQLEAATGRAGEALFARNIRVLRLGLDAWIARLDGDSSGSVGLMRAAADLEAATPKHAVTPAPTLPATELLGDLLLDLHRPAEALAAYRESMALYPQRLNGLLGAARAARALDDDVQARAYYRDLLRVMEGGTRAPVLREAREYLARRR
jgi:tetratricopeptide (TPR) repeat protein